MNNTQLKIEGIPLDEFVRSDSLWSYRDAASYLKFSEGYLRNSVMQNKIPFVRIGRTIRFKPDDIKAWLKSRTHTPEAK